MSPRTGDVGFCAFVPYDIFRKYPLVPLDTVVVMLLVAPPVVTGAPKPLTAEVNTPPVNQANPSGDISDRVVTPPAVFCLYILPGKTVAVPLAVPVTDPIVHPPMVPDVAVIIPASVTENTGLVVLGI